MILLSQENSKMPYEGINSKGLFIGISAVAHTSTTTNILKPIRKSLEMVRVVLKNSSNIKEAVDKFKKYSIAFGEFLGNPLIHFKIVQRDGKGVVVEFVDNKMIILKDKNIMTNHYLSKSKTSNKNSKKRYMIIKNSLNSANTVKKLFSILSKVSQKDTIYSSVYNLDTQVLYIKYRGKKIKKYSLKNEVYKQKIEMFYDMKSGKKEIVKDTSSHINIRPHFGYGVDNLTHYGVRILLNSNPYQAYGFEITNFKDKNKQFQAVGIVLEQRLWGYFNMSIGTIGYFNYGENGENFIGVVSNLGWEPDNHIPFKPFITYRNDVIFAQKIKSLHSISVGFKFEF